MFPTKMHFTSTYHFEIFRIDVNKNNNSQQYQAICGFKDPRISTNSTTSTTTLTVTSHIGLGNFRDNYSLCAAPIRALKPENQYRTSVRECVRPQIKWKTYIHARGSNHVLSAITLQ
jgi:hypothetical protein